MMSNRLKRDALRLSLAPSFGLRTAAGLLAGQGSWRPGQSRFAHLPSGGRQALEVPPTDGLKAGSGARPTERSRWSTCSPGARPRRVPIEFGDAAATVNLSISALRGVVRIAWRCGLAAWGLDDSPRDSAHRAYPQHPRPRAPAGVRRMLSQARRAVAARRRGPGTRGRPSLGAPPKAQAARAAGGHLRGAGVAAIISPPCLVLPTVPPVSPSRRSSTNRHMQMDVP